MIQTSIARCGLCHRIHEHDQRRYRCLSCGEVLCHGLIWSGRPFNRKGEFLHVNEITRRDTGNRTLRPCGRVSEIPRKTGNPMAADTDG